MYIGILGAMTTEIEAFKKLLSNYKLEVVNGMVFHIGTYKGKNLVITQSGVGKVKMAIAVAVLLEHYPISYVINVGISGSVDSEIGTTAVATTVGYHDYVTYSEEYDYPDIDASEKIINHAKKIFTNCLFGRFLTGDQFVSSIELLKMHNADLTNVVSFDMESMAVATACDFYHKDFLIIRTVSDNFSFENANKFEIQMAEKSVNFAIKFIETYEE